MINITVQIIRDEGYNSNTYSKVKTTISPHVINARTAKLAHSILDFVKKESDKVGQNETLIGSSEIIESVFGKLKYIERNQSRSGITGLSLTLAACVSSISKKTIKAAMESVKTKDVLTWIRSNIGDTVQSKRKKIYQGISDNNSKELISCHNHAVAA